VYITVINVQINNATSVSAAAAAAAAVMHMPGALQEHSNS